MAGLRWAGFGVRRFLAPGGHIAEHHRAITVVDGRREDKRKNN